jgi:hypothetical protein
MWIAVVFHDLHKVGEATSSEIMLNIPSHRFEPPEMGCSPVMGSENISKNPTKMEISPAEMGLTRTSTLPKSEILGIFSPALGKESQSCQPWTLDGLNMKNLRTNPTSPANSGSNMIYPLVKTQKAMENHHV